MIEHTMDGLSINIEQTNLDKLRSEIGRAHV